MIFDVLVFLIGVCIGLLVFGTVFLVARFRLKEKVSDALEISANKTILSVALFVFFCFAFNLVMIKPKSEAVVLDSIRVAEAEDAKSVVDKGYVYYVDNDGKPIKKTTKFMDIYFSDEVDGVYIEKRDDEYKWLKSRSYSVLVIPESVSGEIISSW